ncbi:MAG: TonB-dependent receptor plug domain-containing protein [Algicola sp.]|nr:TonB-dependent receptor plug domain-containing protein [Algicola sp.]
MKYSHLTLCIACAILTGNIVAKELERVTVTGSHIKHSELETASPLTVISKEQILQSGIINVENLLQELTASAGPAGNATNAYWTSNGYGTAQVNLRGLGIKRTLVLVNSKRFVNGGTGANSSVDLNMIPVATIQRIEVLKDGASAIYGADAIAGVVNIITDRHFEGVELSSRIGRSTKSDGDERQLSLTLGTHGDRFSGSVNLSYVNTDAVLQSSRFGCPMTEVQGDAGSSLECIGSSTTIGGRAHFCRWW